MGDLTPHFLGVWMTATSLPPPSSDGLDPALCTICCDSSSWHFHFSRFKADYYAEIWTVKQHKFLLHSHVSTETEQEKPTCISYIFQTSNFLFHCRKYWIRSERFYNQIQQDFVNFNQLSYTELIVKLMNSQNFSVNSHLLKFVSLCNDLRTNLLSNHADDTWLTVVIIALHYHCYKL